MPATLPDSVVAHRGRSRHQAKKSQPPVPASLASGMLPQVSRTLVNNPSSLAQRAGVAMAPRFRKTQAPLPSENLTDLINDDGGDPVKKMVRKKPMPCKGKNKEPVRQLERTTSQVRSDH